MIRLPALRALAGVVPGVAAAALIVAVAALAGCGDAAHEPVKVIATPRPPPAAPPPPAALPAGPVAAASSPEVPGPPPTAGLPRAPARAAAASVPVLPGFNDRPPRFIQAGEPTGNDAFRRAFAERAASRPR